MTFYSMLQKFDSTIDITSAAYARSDGWKSWCYAPTNDVLAVLVQLAAVRIGKLTNQEQGESVQSIRLQEFLQFLEERFGILVDRPPAPFDGLLISA